MNGFRIAAVGISVYLMGFVACLASPEAAQAQLADPSNPWAGIVRDVALRYPELPQAALDHAFDYLASHSALVTNQDFLTIIDFDQPSTKERMYVIDLKTSETSTYLVAHGKNSGTLYAVKFSNRVNSNMSSLGIYLTGEPYVGEHGLSLVLKGQDATNSNAEKREVVLHGAAYVSYDFINTYGRLGRSFGCTAVNPAVSSELVQKLKRGSVLYVYHRSPNS